MAASRTPAPKSERIRGSKRNKPGSASKGGGKVTFSKAMEQRIASFVRKYNKANPRHPMTVAKAKKVVRRGMGAYSVSHRRTITGGAPNSRQAWGMARLHAFARKKSKSLTANGVVAYRRIKKSYTQDDDLLKRY